MKRSAWNAKYAYAAICLVLGLLSAVLCFWIRPAADDFFYGTFGDEGWDGFLEINWLHYRTMTGRVFVHLVLYPLLCLDMWPFRVFLLLLIAAMVLLMSRVSTEKRERRLEAAAFSLSIFWLMGIETLADGVLWGAGAMNYLFPVTLVLLYAVLFERFLDGKGGMWLGIPAFFCACTVEMTGILPIVVFGYLCLTQWEKVRQKWGKTLFLGLCTLAGFAFLFTTEGVATRLENNETSLSLLESILVNYSMIDRRVIGPEGIWAVTVLALASCGGVLLRSGKGGWGAALMAMAGLVTLTGVGVIYDGVAVAVIALAAFTCLTGFAIWSFLLGERQVPLWMLCITVSLGVCLVSPVMGSRLVFPTAVFLGLIAVRNLMGIRLPERWSLGLIGILAAAACVLLVDYSIHYAQNAAVIDENTRITQEHTGGALELNTVPDERYSKDTVPSGTNFGQYYLKHHDLEDTYILCQEPAAAQVYAQGELLEHRAVLRDGAWYLPIRAVEAAGDVQIRWELASAVVETADGMYCFHAGNYVVNLGHGICGSEKLNEPVRFIHGRIYVSLEDLRELFDIDLTVEPSIS